MKNQYKMTDEDFEKGLMLLGIIPPVNQQEEDEKLAVEVYERYKLKVGDKTQYGTIEYIDLMTVIYEECSWMPVLLSTYTAFPVKI